MEENRSDLKAVLRELASEGEQARPHVGVKRLISYRQGTLPEEEREAVQEHLSLCPRCTKLLRELRDFEAASAGGATEGPESLREEAWASLVRRLPAKTPAVRPIAGSFPAPSRMRHAPRLVYALAAALLLAAVGLSLWTSLEARQERQRLAAKLEQQLEEREEALAAARRSLAEAENQLAAARGRIQNLEKDRSDANRSAEAGARVEELEARIAELTSALEKLRRAPQPDHPASASTVALSVAPLFTLRGQESPELLRGDAVNPVRSLPQGDRVTMGLNLADHPAYGEYRIELLDRDGKVLWSGRRRGSSLLGDAGTSVSVSGLGPGLYRLRVEGLSPDRTDLLGEYVIELAGQEEPG